MSQQHDRIIKALPVLESKGLSIKALVEKFDRSPDPIPEAALEKCIGSLKKAKIVQRSVFYGKTGVPVFIYWIRPEDKRIYLRCSLISKQGRKV